IHVSDLADAHVAALEWIAADKSSNSFNLGNERGFSVAEVIRTAEEVTGSAIKAQMCPRRPGDPPMLVSDSTKARQLLNWKPKFPALKEAIDHAFRWFRDEMQQLDYLRSSRHHSVKTGTRGGGRVKRPGTLPRWSLT